MSGSAGSTTGLPSRYGCLVLFRRLARRLALASASPTALAATIALASAAFVCTTSLTGCQDKDQEISGQIRIATGNPGAVYHRYGTVYADLLRQRSPKIHATVIPTAASAENVLMIKRGAANVAFTQADAVTADDAASVATLARLYEDCLHLVVRADDPIRSIADLRGKKVSIGGVGSGTEVTAIRLLTVTAADQDRPVAVQDLTIERWGLDSSTEALKDGTIDAFFFSGGLPVDLIATLAKQLPVRLIDLGRYVIPMRRAFGDHYTERVVPKTTYGIAPAVSIGIPNYLVVPTTMPSQTAYALTEVLLSGKGDLAAAHPVGASLNRRDAISTPPLPLHPGAARYYRDVKI